MSQHFIISPCIWLLAGLLKHIWSSLILLQRTTIQTIKFGFQISVALTPVPHRTTDITLALRVSEAPPDWFTTDYQSFPTQKNQPAPPAPYRPTDTSRKNK